MQRQGQRMWRIALTSKRALSTASRAASTMTAPPAKILRASKVIGTHSGSFHCKLPSCPCYTTSILDYYTHSCSTDAVEQGLVRILLACWAQHMRHGTARKSKCMDHMSASRCTQICYCMLATFMAGDDLQQRANVCFTWNLVVFTSI